LIGLDFFEVLFVGHGLLQIFVFLSALILGDFLLVFFHEFRIAFEKLHQLFFLRDLLFRRGFWEYVSHRINIYKNSK
jgi:hypothetical protein